MPVAAKVALIVVAVLVVLLIVLVIVGRNLQKKQEASSGQMEAMAQTMSMLVIDKKMMKLKDANLPKIVLEQTPKYLRGSKVPVVKVKAGPNIMNLISDAKIFDQIPIKTEIKAKVSGIYIMEILGSRGKVKEEPKKKGFLDRFKKEK
ncbi:MAG: hypothetical protein E7262_03480 [Lachnospiraceae bacterium]|nr:hypothetical protein [Lachnospiraceae bacterium]